MSEIIISASKLKTVQSCSYKYYANYVLKLPQEGNLGSTIGGKAHIVLECLLKERSKKTVAWCIEHNTLTPAIYRLIKKQLKSEDILNDKNFALFCECIRTGLNNDFYIEGSQLQPPEVEFNINDGFRARGFIDKFGLKGNTAHLQDFKTSKQKYSQHEMDDCTQGLMYLLAMTYMYPGIDIENSQVDFLFLQFHEDPKQTFKTDKCTLAGFKEYLRHIQIYLENFTEKDAVSNMAADMSYPTKDEGFCKKLACGFSKSPGQLKRDGNIMFACSYKWAFDYFAIVNNKGEVIKSAFKKEDLNPKDGESIVEKHYAGCPRFN